MGKLTSTSRLVANLRDRLQTHLQAEVLAHGLPAIKEFLRHSPARINPTMAPQVWVNVQRVSPGGPAGFGGPNATQTRSRIVLVGVTACGEDADAAQEHLEGYADLVLKVMDANQSARGPDNTGPNEGYRVRHTGTDFSPNFGNFVGTALFREAVLTFEITRLAAVGQD